MKPGAATKCIHVLAGVVRDRQQRILIARRPAHKHQGGLWEFPGGKLHAGESRAEALRREFDEELGLRIGRARPLIRVLYAYPDLTVDLDVWQVQDYAGEAFGREGQQIAWVPELELSGYEFPLANLPILKALRLPDLYWVTPATLDEAKLLTQTEHVLSQGIRLLQFRVPDIPAGQRAAMLEKLLPLVRRHRDARLLVNEDIATAIRVGADGVHLKQAQLMALSARPMLNAGMLLSASCHDAHSLKQAQALDLDFVTLSPLHVTPSHPAARPLGWARFASLVAGCSLPVYALGGLGPADLDAAWQAGAQGIAGIRKLA